MALTGRVVSAEDCWREYGTSTPTPFTTTVKMTIRRLRAKLGEPPVIQTVPQAGYRI
jgi:DNA-binding response OmpR family regulator